MSYAKYLGGYFVAFALTLILLYSGLVVGALFVTEDYVYERILELYADSALQSEANSLVDIELYSANTLPDSLKGLGSKVVEIDDTHLLIKPLPNGQTLLLRMPEFHDLIDSVLMYFYALLAVIGLSVLVFSALLAHSLAVRLSKPLKQLADDVRDAGESNETVAVSSEQLELGQLATSFNQAMRSLREALDREKFFTRAISHELRSPLTVMSSDVTILESYAETDSVLERVSHRMHRAVQQMSKLTGVFLLLARNDYRHMPSDNVYASALLKKVIAEMNIPESTLLIDSAEEQEIEVVPDLLEILLRNLLENAQKYAIGPVSFVFHADGFTTSNLYEEITIDESGSGLGLELVERISHSAGWSLHVNCNSGNFTLRVSY